MSLKFFSLKKFPLQRITNMPPKKLLSIGQCCADHSSISRLLTQNFQIEIINADNSKEAESLISAGTFSLILVNRIFDTNGESGLAFIKKYCSQQTSTSTPIMLESCKEEASLFTCSVNFLPRSEEFSSYRSICC